MFLRWLQLNVKESVDTYMLPIKTSNISKTLDIAVILQSTVNSSNSMEPVFKLSYQ